MVPYGAEIRAERVAVDDSETMIGADCEKRNDEKSEEPHGTDRCMGE
ncbi:BnaC01g37280D [Brassica napus]|uniref:BnaC01g37280D protein n=2 Tax=Brassica napus TaxID=3708 RepID=A0A078H3N5_BRANA|nr:BnaC01g37280D [Brassica napus]